MLLWHIATIHGKAKKFIKRTRESGLCERVKYRQARQETAGEKTGELKGGKKIKSVGWPPRPSLPNHTL